MCGAECGAVTCVSGVKNPVLAARMVMEQTPHCFIQGPEATALARDSGLEMCEEEYFVTAHRTAQLRETQAVEGGNSVILDHQQAGVPKTTKMGTVGAVVRDEHGNLAGMCVLLVLLLLMMTAVTSSGGMCNKWAGRVGGVPVIGAATYVSKDVAVSCTGMYVRLMHASRVVSTLIVSQARASRSLFTAAQRVWPP